MSKPICGLRQTKVETFGPAVLDMFVMFYVPARLRLCLLVIRFLNHPCTLPKKHVRTILLEMPIYSFWLLSAHPCEKCWGP